MGFVKNDSKEITVPGGSITIRKLSGRSLDRARQARQIEVAQSMAGMTEQNIRGLFGTPEARRLEAAKESGKKPSFDDARKARYAQYDRGVVLVAGILRWSFSDTVPTDPLDAVDDETAQTTHEAIIDFSLKPIDPSEYEVEMGKGSEVFTSS
jgi:hypothetical protein